LYEENTDYWSELVKFTKHMSLARTMRTLTIMGRSENEEKIELAKLLYPPMQEKNPHVSKRGFSQNEVESSCRSSP
jgi:tyrosyl-tRNA synthetase